MVPHRAGGRRRVAAGLVRPQPEARNPPAVRPEMPTAEEVPDNLHQPGAARVRLPVVTPHRRVPANLPALRNRCKPRPVRPQRRSVTPRPGAVVRFLVENRTSQFFV